MTDQEPRLPGSFLAPSTAPSASSTHDEMEDAQTSLYLSPNLNFSSSLGKEMSGAIFAEGIQDSSSRCHILSPIMEVDSNPSESSRSDNGIASLPSDEDSLSSTRHARVESYHSNSTPSNSFRSSDEFRSGLEITPPNSDHLVSYYQRDNYRPLPVSYMFAARNPYNPGPDPAAAVIYNSDAAAIPPDVLRELNDGTPSTTIYNSDAISIPSGPGVVWAVSTDTGSPTTQQPFTETNPSVKSGGTTKPASLKAHTSSGNAASVHAASVIASKKTVVQQGWGYSQASPKKSAAQSQAASPSPSKKPAAQSQAASPSPSKKPAAQSQANSQTSAKKPATSPGRRGISFVSESAQGDFEAIFSRTPMNLSDTSSNGKHVDYLSPAENMDGKDDRSNSPASTVKVEDVHANPTAKVHHETGFANFMVSGFSNTEDKIDDLDTRLNRLTLDSPPAVRASPRSNKRPDSRGKGSIYDTSPANLPPPQSAMVSDSTSFSLSMGSPTKAPLPPSPLSNYSHLQDLQRQARSGSRVDSPFNQAPPLFPLSVHHPDGIKAITPARSSRNTSPVRVYPESPALNPIRNESPTRSPRSKHSRASSESVEIDVAQTFGKEPMVFPDFDIDRLTVYPPQIYSKADIIAKPGDPEGMVPPTIGELKKSHSATKNKRDVLVNVICVVAILSVLGLSFYFSRAPGQVGALTRRAIFGRQFGEFVVPPLEVIELQAPVRLQYPPEQPKVGGIMSWLHPELRTDLQKRELQTQSDTECIVKLFHHEFGWSYGKPFVGTYTPPPCSFTHVYFNISTTSAGRQFDRLALLFLDDIEIWRTSTAEPSPYGIIFGFSKDMTHFSNLLRKPAKLIFDLGNLVDDTYTGKFDVTMTATFYSPQAIRPPTPAHDIIPISAKRSLEDGPSQFSVPHERAATTFRLPDNTIRAIMSVSASGNGGEEFWYTCVLNSLVDAFGPGRKIMCGDSAFREVQIWIDGALVGTQFPYPTLYTGGLSPAFWRPIVSFGTYDVKEYEFDITPWLPRLLGKDVEFEIKVVAYDDETETLKSTKSDWIVTGRVFVWKDRKPDWKTRGMIFGNNVKDPVFSVYKTIQQSPEGDRNTSVSYSMLGARQIFGKATITTSDGPQSYTAFYDLHFKIHTTVYGEDYLGFHDYSSHGSYQISTPEGEAAQGYKWIVNLNTNYVSRHHTMHRENEVVGKTAKGIVFDATYGPNCQTSVWALSDNEVFPYNSEERFPDRYSSNSAKFEQYGTQLHNETAFAYARIVYSEDDDILEDEEIINGIQVKAFGLPPPLPIPPASARPAPVVAPAAPVPLLPLVKPAAQPPVKPAVQPPVKPAVKPPTKPAVKPPVKPAVVPAKPAVKPAARPMVLEESIKKPPLTDTKPKPKDIKKELEALRKKPILNPANAARKQNSGNKPTFPKPRPTMGVFRPKRIDDL